MTDLETRIFSELSKGRPMTLNDLHHRLKLSPHEMMRAANSLVKAGKLKKSYARSDGGTAIWELAQ